MKTALLAQNEALEAKTLNPDVKKSMIPLSHSVMYPVDIDGAILPCCCVEVVPSDSYFYFINIQIFCQSIFYSSKY